DIRYPPGVIMWRNGAVATMARTAAMIAGASAATNPRSMTAPSPSASAAKLAGAPFSRSPIAALRVLLTGQLPSPCHRRIIFVRLPAVEKAVVGDDAHAPMPIHAVPERRRAIRSLRVAPGSQQQEFPGRIDAFEQIRIDEAPIECRRVCHERSPFGDGDDRGGARLRRVEALLGRARSVGQRGIGNDLAHAQVIVLEHLEAALLLHNVVEAVGPPADEGLLVAPGGKREQPALAALAGEALVVDKALDLLQFRLQRLRVV